MGLATTLTNSKFTNNFIGDGYANNGTTTTHYTYTKGLSTSLNTKIIGNTFTGATSAISADLLNIVSASCEASANTFIRGNNTLGAYITVSSSADQVIINNIFDNTTVNGSSDVLVSGLTNGSIYSNNKNQTIYVPANYLSFGFSTGIFGSDSSNFIENDSESKVNKNGNYLEVLISETGQKFVMAVINLNAAIPLNAKIVEAKIGISAQNFSSTLSSSGNSFSYSLFAQDVVVGSYSAGTGSILDAFLTPSPTETVSSSSLDLDVNQATLEAQSMYLTTAVSSEYFRNTRNYSLTAEIILSANLSSAGAGPLGYRWRISPLVLKCVW